MSKQTINTNLIAVTPSQMDAVKTEFAYSEMPLNSKEIIVEITEEDLDNQSDALPELELGYNILFIQ